MAALLDQTQGSVADLRRKAQIAHGSMPHFASLHHVS